MTASGFTRRHALGSMAGATALLAAPAFVRAQGSLTKLSYQTGWLAQAEHGGLYQAQATGIYREHGIDLEIRPGGPQMNVVSLFVAGKCDFTEIDSFRMISMVQEKLPGVAIAAFFQKDPRVLMSHPGQGNDTLESLKGKPILVATAGRQTYWQWLKAKYGYADEQIRPYTFNIAPFLADKKVSMQGYITSEPFAAKQAGVDPVIHLLADGGFDNYSSLAIAAPKMVQDKPELVQRFVTATAKGWQSYLHGDPAPANKAIRAANADMPEDKLAFAIDAMKKWSIVDGGDAKALGLGAMTDARWQRFYEMMVASGAQQAGVDLKSGYTLQFVNKRAA